MVLSFLVTLALLAPLVDVKAPGAETALAASNVADLQKLASKAGGVTVLKLILRS